LLRGDDRLEPLVIPTAAATRVIITVRTAGTSEQTAFFDPDPQIAQEEAEHLYLLVEGMMAEGPIEALTLSGSSPSAATHGLYSDLIALARARQVPVFLDTYGPALDGVWGFWPDVIQLNRREAAAHLRKPMPTEAELLDLLESWTRRGARLALVTNGSGDVLIHLPGGRFRAHPPKIQAVNPIGSGDCLLAGLVDACLSGLNDEAALRRGLACAVANALVWDAGSIDPQEVRRLEPLIEIDAETP
jgi:fructose-1-phosphate kinase PfkB-like protein